MPRIRKMIKILLDDAQLKSSYPEFADEDRELAEAELADYATSLAREDEAQ